MFIGIDAGGTKTAICICTVDGHIVHYCISDGINAARLGADAAAGQLAELIAKAGYSPLSLYAGVAGAGSPLVSSRMEDQLRAMLPGAAQITVTSDAFNGLNSVVGRGDGIALIAGTGSSAFLRRGGKITQVGGRGYLIDDAGSGYWAGRACLNAAYRALDGRGGDTLMLAKVEEKLGMPLAAAIPDIYEKGASYIASFAPTVFECAEAGDEIATGIAEDSIHELWLHVKACLDLCAVLPGICVATGGMFRAGYIKDRLTALAEKAGLRMVFPSLPPVAGAVIAAAGDAADAAFTKTLKDDLDGLQ